MKIHTTNYFNTLIEVSEDSKTEIAKIPVAKGVKVTVATIEFQVLSKHKFSLTSDELLFEVFAIRNDISETERNQVRSVFFSKGQACLRCSPLAKSYGWGFYFNSEGKIALIPMESDEYQSLLVDKSITKVKAMRSSRKQS